MKNIAILSLLLLSACSGIKVNTQYDKSIAFDQYKTWCWLRGCELVYQGPGYLYDSTVIETIGNYIAQEMYDKGFVQVDDHADLMIDFHIAVKEDSARFARIHEEDLPYWSDYQEDYYHFLRGTLTIDIIDRARGQVIWQSIARSYMALYPQIDDQLIDKGVRKLLKKFPPDTNVQADTSQIVKGHLYDDPKPTYETSAILFDSQ
ncbi:DUF4136 domain-containing protein [Fulvivirga aurantia]|uniref:DUF4136 domain-containing protein n=1 Tax=Fulvivirga aurantia TaxID=2529383 RepID=UPI001626F5F5|nr:DUF4136 domain-containing protein [Fulvivirga aurantia]